MPRRKVIDLEAPNTLPIAELRSILRQTGKFVVTCQLCGEYEAHDVHHLNSHHWDNTPSNLAPVCKRCHNRVHGISDRLTDLTLAARQLDSIKRQRVAMNNRLTAYQKLRYDAPMAHELYQALVEITRRGEKIVSEMVEQEIVYQRYLSKIKGTGPLTSAILITEIGSIDRFETVSALWSYSGLATNKNGDIQKRQAGKTSNWNHKIRSTCIGIVVPGFIRLKGHDDCFGRTLYERYKAFYTERDGDKLTKGHIENRARRKVAKIFLACLWAAWRRIDGLPVTKPWSSRIGHKHFITPKDWAGNDWFL